MILYKGKLIKETDTMPNTVKFSNKTAFKNGAERARWKLDRTLELLDTDPQLSKVKSSDVDFDRRDLNAFITLLVDISDYADKPNDVKEAYFKEEAKKIASAFLLTHDENNPRMPDFKAVEPYIRRLYSEVKLDNNIDWNNENEIDALFSSANCQQALSTVNYSFSAWLARIYTVEEKRKIDSDCIKASANQYLLKNAVIKEDSAFASAMRWGSVDLGNRNFFVDIEISLAVAEATQGGKTVVFDPDASEITKNYFLGDEFELDEIGEVYEKPVYDRDSAAKNYLTAITEIIEKACFDNNLKIAAEDNEYEKTEFLLINGEPVKDILEREMANGLDKNQAQINVGYMLRSAMTDGSSVVTLMRPMLNEEGKMSFRHQELKVDLDKLNDMDRTAHYSIFRRVLNFFKLYKIPPMCASNKERDKAQAAKMAEPEMKDALKRAEDKFIAQYNKKAANENSNIILNTFPKTSRLEPTEENRLELDTENKPNLSTEKQHGSRQPMTIDPKELDANTKHHLEPKKEISHKITESTKEV